MRLRTRLLIHIPGLTDEGIDRMDYRRFFGYVRELDIYLQEKAEAVGGNERKKSNEGDIHAALSQLPQPEQYTGETIPLI